MQKGISRVLRSTKFLFGRYWEHSKAFVVLILLLNLILSAIPLIIAWTTRSFVDQLAGMTQDSSDWIPNSLFLLALCLVGFLFMQDYLSILLSYLDERKGRNLLVQTKMAVYERIGSFGGIQLFEQPAFFDLLRMVMHSAQSGHQQVFQTLLRTCRNVVLLLAFALAILSYSPLILLVIAISTLPQITNHLHSNHENKQLDSEIGPHERNAYYLEHLLTNSSTIKEILALGIGSHLRNDLQNRLLMIASFMIHSERKRLKTSTTNRVLIGIAQGLSLLIITAMVSTREIGVGDVAFLIAGSQGILSATIGILEGFSLIHSQSLYFEDYEKLVNLVDPIITGGSRKKMSGLLGEIRFEGVSFRYSTNLPWVLRDVELSIRAGESTAIVGQNGSGKSTLIRLLLRLYDPTCGTIYWDGVDVREFPVEDYRKTIGVMFQDYARYQLTVRENIGFGDIENIHEIGRISRAARLSGADNVVQGLSNNYETVLSKWNTQENGGVDISGGEWQKIALARLLMREASLYILDEPTSNLDASSETAFNKGFSENKRGKTFLISSHRLSSIMMADNVALLRDGKITDYGPPQRLLNSSELFFPLEQRESFSERTDSL